MPVSTKSNVPQHEALKWNIAKAATEFGVSRDTLKKALNERSVAADSDGLYSTSQIVEGLYGSMHIERLKTQREITKKYSLENAVTVGSLLNRDALAQGLAAIADAITSRIMVAQELSRATKEDLLKDLSSIPVVIADVARKQSRFRDGKNRPVESADEDSL